MAKYKPPKMRRMDESASTRTNYQMGYVPSGKDPTKTWENQRSRRGNAGNGKVVNVSDMGIDRMSKALEDRRAPLIPRYQEITKYICPNRGFYDTESDGDRGDQNNVHLLDATPTRALETLQSGMYAGMTNPSTQWFKLQMLDDRLNEALPIRTWLSQVESQIWATLAQSNYYKTMFEFYGELASFGTAAYAALEDDENILYTSLFTAGEYCVGYNRRGEANQFFRKFRMSAYEMQDEYGEDALSTSVSQALQGNRPDTLFTVCNLIVPSDFLNPDDDPVVPHPYVSFYWQQGEQETLRVRGFWEFPIMTGRWGVVGSNQYGYGPGWNALGESKTLQEMRYDLLLGNKMDMFPPVVFPGEMRNKRFTGAPGEVFFSDSQTQAYRLYGDARSNIEGQLVAIEGSRQQINSFFFTDVFLMVSQMAQQRDMTAYQVSVLQQEKMQLLGPVTERVTQETLSPTLGRVFQMLQRRGLIPPPPPELSGRIEIEYVSPLAQAQKGQSASQITSILEITGATAQIAPEVIDKINPDKVVEEYARLTSAPPTLLRDDNEVLAIRQQRADAQAQAAEAEQLKLQTESMRNVAGAAQQAANAPTDGNTALSGLLNELGMGGSEQ